MTNDMPLEASPAEAFARVLPVEISRRYYFSLNYILGATHFARLSWKAECDYSGTFDTQRFLEHRSNVTGSIVLATSFLEATVNELFSDAGEKTSELTDGLPSKTLELMAKLWGSEKIKDRIDWGAKRGDPKILAKYQKALKLAGRPRFEKNLAPYEPVKLLIYFRNALMHYEPEWLVGDTLPKNDWAKQLEELHFALNPMLPKPNPFFPDQCLSHGCAKWAIESSLGFVREFCGRIGIAPLFDKGNYNLATE